MSRWSKEDKKVFNNSEVMLEMEKNLMENIYRYAHIIKESQSGTDSAKKKMEDLSNAAGETSESIGNLKKEMADLAHDEEMSDDCGYVIDQEDENVDVDAMEKSAMISELESLAKKALSGGNYSDLYKIERAIQEIKDGE